MPDYIANLFSSSITLNKMKDTTLIDLTKYTFMPPQRVNPEIKFEK